MNLPLENCILWFVQTQTKPVPRQDEADVSGRESNGQTPDA